MRIALLLIFLTFTSPASAELFKLKKGAHPPSTGAYIVISKLLNIELNRAGMIEASTEYCNLTEGGVTWREGLFCESLRERT